MTDQNTAALSTARLELIPATAALLRCEIESREALGNALNAAIPEVWPPVEVRDALPIFLARREALEAKAPKELGKWAVYYWIAVADGDMPRTLVGSGGFMGAPNAEGTVEIGYGTHADYHRRGYAAEAVRALAEFARNQPDVRHVIADALPENVGSVGVLIRSSFREVGAGAEEGTRRFEYLP